MEFGETIAAIATAPGVGAVSIIRVVGQNAFQTAEKIFINKTRPMEWQSHTCRVGSLVDPKNGEIIDQVLISCMKAPNSYTGYDTVEINCHGGVLNTKKILELVLALGVRLAEPGEFTRLAFLNGKMDLSRVEAVADLISAKTDAARRASAAQLMGSLADDVRGLRSQLLKLCSLMELDLDFGEENLLEIGANQIKHQIQSVLDHARRLSSTYDSGHLLRDGAKVAIVGKPNVGKSSLLNAMLRKNRAIVSETAGTTRDFIEETVDIGGVPFTFVDTAGVRDTTSEVEFAGIKWSLEHMKMADLILAVFDGSTQKTMDDEILERHLEAVSLESPTTRIIRIANKSDLGTGVVDGIPISAKTGDGIEELRATVASEFNLSLSFESPILTRERHKVAIDAAIKCLQSASNSCGDGYSYEFVALDIRNAMIHLGEIVGEVSSEDVINNIFSSFCIGK